jgi:hypothetical protein
MQNCLDKAMEEFLTCDQVTELNERAELTTLSNTLIAIISSTSLHNERTVGITVMAWKLLSR